jgi:hypothetical protein
MINDAIKYEYEEDYYEIQFGCIDGNTLKTGLWNVWPNLRISQMLMLASSEIVQAFLTTQQ